MAGGAMMSSITWRLHHESADAWAVYDQRDQCIAAVAPQPDSDGYWQGVVRPRPDGPYPGIRIDHCPSREQAMGVVGRELSKHWPEVVGSKPLPGDGGAA